MSESHDFGLVSAADAAARLGVKRETLYAYVSRGLIHRTVAMDGRSSLFDPGEIEAFRMGKLDRAEGELRTVITTKITQVHDDALLIRGHDLVELVSTHSFLEIIDLLWESPSGEEWPAPVPTLTTTLPDLDGLRVLVATASSTDPLRHDLSPRSVRSAGRSMIVGMAHGTPPAVQTDEATVAGLSSAIWRRLTGESGTTKQHGALDAALSLLVDHGLASSTFAARIAASVRADPYSVIGAGLGVLGGALHGAASARVHELLVDTARLDDAAKAVGEALRILDRVPGFGHTVYTRQDPRYGALMALIVEAWADDPRLRHVYAVRDVVAERRADMPNVDLALGALTWLAGMEANAGETIFSIARSAGWLAHAMEEYDEAPLRFRPKARYVGQRSGSDPIR